MDGVSNSTVVDRATILDKAFWIVIAGACAIAIAMGVRQTFGLFLGPFSTDHGIPVTTFALAVAIQNLVWGLGQPVAGAIADNHGAGRVVGLGGLLYGAGLVLTGMGGDHAWAVIVGSGIMIGLGLSCTTFAVVLGVVGRAVAPNKRSVALGIASAGGSLGQVGIVPMAQKAMDGFGVDAAILGLSLVAFVIVPLAFPLTGRPKEPSQVAAGGESQSARQAIALAGRHSGFLYLTAGFFVCGFQLAFIGTHLPGYLTTCSLPAALGATAFAVIGFFNMVGTWACGGLGTRFRFKNLLAILYIVRGLAILLFLWAPKSEASVLVFATVMGLTWLGTVPLTSGLVAQIFGPRYLGTLFGLCFLSHQIGSFFGAWLGGYLFDTLGSYDLIWILTGIAGFVAGLLHMPINDRTIGAVLVGMDPTATMKAETTP
jgi:predicted MFS family arabinose efflux permease